MRTVKAALFVLTILLLHVPPAAAHYDFGWSFAGPNDEASVHARKIDPNTGQRDVNDGFAVEYDFLTQKCPGTNPPWNTYERPDEPVRVFRFLQNDGNTRKLQMNLGIAMRNARWIGTTLFPTVVRGQDVVSDLQREHLLPQPELRTCGDNTVAGRENDQITVYRSPRPLSTYGAPWDFQQNEWLTSPYHVAGPSPTVYALIHHEFHGTKYSAATNCPSANADLCTMNSVTLAKSKAADQSQSIPNRLGSSYGTSGIGGVGTGGGFRASKDTILGTLPQQYQPEWGFKGYGTLTNIIKRSEGTDDYYYFLVNVNPVPDPDFPNDVKQDPGACVLRTRTTEIDTPSSWRAWDGQGWNARYRNPYQDPFPNGMLTLAQRLEQICKVVSTGFGPRQLTFNENLKKYMIMGENKTGMYYSLSDDLINWSSPQLILADPVVTTNPDCSAEDTLHYPDILDPDDAASGADPTIVGANTNFDHPDRTAYLYTTRAPCPVPFTPKGKDLVRTPIKFVLRSASLEPPSGPTDAWPGYPQNDYDSQSGVYFAKLNTGYSYGEAGDSWSGLATSWPFQNIREAYGRHKVRWNTGDDVWYGSAFKIPTDFVASNDSVQIMSWHTAANVYGGIVLDAGDNRWHMVRSGTGGGYFGQPFDLPTGRWTWVEVHQKFGTTSGGGTLTEVFVDGRLVSATSDPNRTESAPITNVRYGIVWNATSVQNASPSTQNIEVDRSSINGGQLGALDGSQAYRAPATPLGLRQTPNDSTHITLAWNVSSDPTVAGYRLYEQQTDGTWGPLGGEAVDTPVTKTVASCSTHTYRVTAYRSFGANPIDWAESIVSSPLTVKPTGCP
jgi:Polysaccharide lyase